ncbi:hypothetical protein MBT42_00065 [Streptomyces sp. MBT42]|uniref:hypothetical protein n=1 Tax=Streptomyces sp. MBT42 TaxID=1488373 RepID=UPI001E3F2427|nr:hypothetical protein [Streptomyces sp. MBT42]MCD2461952.1 hypothetical protein [Streptomyces sp. MBT42]
MTTCQMCDTHPTDGYLCPGCTRTLAEQLLRMPALYRALAAFLPPAARGAQHGSHGPAAEAPMPVVEHVLDLRGPGGMVGILERQRAALHAARGWVAPALGVGILNRVALAAGGLAHSLDWAAESWPDAGDFARAIRDLHGSAASVVHPRLAEERGTRLGMCPQLVSEDEAEGVCGAPLKHYPGDRAVTCRWCGTVYEPHAWTALRDWIDYEESNARLVQPS